MKTSLGRLCHPYGGHEYNAPKNHRNHDLDEAQAALVGEWPALSGAVRVKRASPGHDFHVRSLLDRDAARDTHCHLFLLAMKATKPNGRGGGRPSTWKEGHGRPVGQAPDLNTMGFID